jgi:hypothetical protein
MGWFVVAAVLVAVLFQLSFRYSYVHTIGTQVARIDRLTGASCVMPCASAQGASSDAPLASAQVLEGPGSDYIRPRCAYFAFGSEANDNRYGIFKLAHGEQPNEGSTVSGDLDGFGIRTVHDNSSNADLAVDIVYQADSFEAVVNRLDVRYHCAVYPNRTLSQSKKNDFGQIGLRIDVCQEAKHEHADAVAMEAHKNRDEEKPVYDVAAELYFACALSYTEPDGPVTCANYVDAGNDYFKDGLNETWAFEPAEMFMLAEDSYNRAGISCAGHRRDEAERGKNAALHELVRLGISVPPQMFH